ncbi:hypothetical protein QZH41_010340, partial [Actinostola sp. cb2023]
STHSLMSTKMEFDLQSSTRIKAFPRTRLFICGIFIGIIVFFIGFTIGYFAFDRNSVPPKSGKSAVSQDARNQEYQDMFLQEVNAEKMGENLSPSIFIRFFSSQVHLAGSPRQKELAEYLSSKWKEYGFDDVEMPEYKVLLSTPQESQPNEITVEGPGKYIDYKIEGKMKIYPDPRVNKTVDFYPFVGYSPNMTVEGDLVYVNYGTTSDYEELEKMNITVKGKIVMSRSVFANVAASKGAKGFITFPDPRGVAPDGISRDITYPNGPWLSKDAVQLLSLFRKSYVGDKLTPGVPATEGIFRKPYINDSDILQIPVQPISYGQAMELFRRMKGHDVPPNWQIPQFNMTLKTGPGFHNDTLKIKLKVNTQINSTSIYNVIGTITGSEEPDRYVIVGNHRDSWVFGAADAVSGTSTTHEIARVLGILRKSGWRPRRTIKICSWGGEEWGMFGSSEWVEENSKVLSERAIAYVNLDIAVQGNFVLRARASPLFKQVTHKWAKKVKDPTLTDGTSMYDTWLKKTPSVFFPGEPQLYNNFRSSDYVMFYDYLGIPSSDYGYWYGYKNKSSMYPVYHTTEDTYYWMQKFVDPQFKVHQAMVQFSGGLLLDLSDSLVIPYNVYDFAKVLNLSYEILDQSHLMKNDNIQEQHMKYLGQAVHEFLKYAKRFEERTATISKQANLQLRMLNDKVVQVEKAFIAPDGLLGRPWDRHVAFNFGFKNANYIQATFPGVTEAAYKALDTGDWETVRKQISLAINSVRMATKVLKPALIKQA